MNVHTVLVSLVRTVTETYTPVLDGKAGNRTIFKEIEGVLINFGLTPQTLHYLVGKVNPACGTTR